MGKRGHGPPKKLSTQELKESYGDLIAEMTDAGNSTRDIADYLQKEYNVKTNKDAVRTVLKAMSEDERPRQCSIDDMTQYVDDSLATCLAGPQMNYSQLFQELQKTHAIDAGRRTQGTNPQRCDDSSGGYEGSQGGCACRQQWAKSCECDTT